MAGIGFKLKKIVDEGSLKDKIATYIQGAMIACGPWLITIAVISTISLFQKYQGPYQDIVIFRSMVTYIYASSLIVFGFFQLPLTRYISDAVYSEEYDKLLPTYRGALLSAGGIYGLVIIPFCFLLNSWSPITQLTLFALALIILGIWVSMIFLTALQHFTSIAVSFVVGGAISTVLAIQLGFQYGLEGHLIGFAIGQMVLLAILTGITQREFPSPQSIDFSCLTYLKKHSFLCLAGGFYNCGIWIDKIMIWASEFGMQISEFIYIAPFYDSPMFFAYLSVIPLYTIFLIHTETLFYPWFKSYFEAFMDHQPLAIILRIKTAMFEKLQEGIWVLIKYQGLVTFLAIFFSSYLITNIDLNLVQIFVFRIGLIGAFAHALLMIVLILILYFEFKNLALLVSATFLISNVLFTAISLNIGVTALGMGFLFACLLSLAIGIYGFVQEIEYLEYNTLIK